MPWAKRRIPPWYAPAKTSTAERPVTARASESARRFASVPELQKRTRSMDGKRAQTASANTVSYRFGAPSTIPSASAVRIASTMTGWEWPYRPAVYSPRKSVYS
jgi:hypothetical protein